MTTYNPKINASGYWGDYLKDGSDENMAVDGSSTPVEYLYTVPAGHTLEIQRFMVTLEDGSVAFVPGDFGAIGGALTNGVEISVTNSGAKYTLATWKTNRQIRDTMFDFNPTFKADGAYVGRWTLSKDMESGITLEPGDKVSALVQDALNALDFFSIRVKGRLRAK